MHSSIARFVRSSGIKLCVWTKTWTKYIEWQLQKNTLHAVDNTFPTWFTFWVWPQIRTETEQCSMTKRDSSLVYVKCVKQGCISWVLRFKVDPNCFRNTARKISTHTLLTYFLLF